MMLMRTYFIVIGILLAACSREQYYERPDLAGEAPTREIIIENIPKIFASSDEPTNVSITEPRPWTEGPLKGWLVCVRATAKLMTSERRRTETVAAFFQGRMLSLRERAQAKHGCDHFEKII
jgi:hypothetical protein